MCSPKRALSLLSLTILGHAQSFSEQCQNFQLSIPNVEVNVLEFVPNGTNITFPGIVSISHGQEKILLIVSGCHMFAELSIYLWR